MQSAVFLTFVLTLSIISFPTAFFTSSPDSKGNTLILAMNLKMSSLLTVPHVNLSSGPTSSSSLATVLSSPFSNLNCSQYSVYDALIDLMSKFSISYEVGSNFVSFSCVHVFSSSSLLSPSSIVRKFKSSTSSS